MTSINALSNAPFSASQVSVTVNVDLSIRPTPLVVPPNTVVLLIPTELTPQLGIPSCAFTQSWIEVCEYLQTPMFVAAYVVELSNAKSKNCAGCKFQLLPLLSAVAELPFHTIAPFPVPIYNPPLEGFVSKEYIWLLGRTCVELGLPLSGVTVNGIRISPVERSFRATP